MIDSNIFTFKTKKNTKDLSQMLHANKNKLEALMGL